ncbi:DUF4832 domain-containing protein [Leclercia adecarboxylata]|uniref:DUF4832 domain-containing protein n=1 Tax=Leclercia adecarboxylata TaxID=83655 RepID=UPI002DBC5216|nr:DUF4832 domain-containing protein [Leclercia adecarboxylata]MEB6379538.1 DUF4832 domain-containing protein [Leclercia adecarboxylata]
MRLDDLPCGKKGLLRLATGVLIFFSGWAWSQSVETLQTVNPPAFSGPLVNPGNGVARFQERDLSIADYPETGLEYRRYYWSEVEPREGQYNFALVDEGFAAAAAHQPAMNVGLRFMILDGPESGSEIPQWLIDKGIKGTWTADHKTFAPDLDDPLYLAYAQRLLQAFGARYNNNPELAFIDIGMVGAWGEWHNSNFPGLRPLQERYSAALLNRYVDMHFSAFPDTPKVMLINGYDSVAYAAKKGAGWRADCWGDWRNFSPSWSHMANDYPERIAAAQAAWPGFNEAWKKAPVSLEICGHMAEWLTTQKYTREEVQATFDWALAQHASTLNIKSTDIPRVYRDIVDKALTKIGYRFRVVSLTHPASVRAGQVVSLTSQWSNDGVAPIYLRYTLAWRLQDRGKHTVAQGSAGDDIRQWLPGGHSSAYQLATQPGLAAGRYHLDVALVDRNSKARIQLANQGKLSDGWYRLSSVMIK